jgi:TadE-like protein
VRVEDPKLRGAFDALADELAALPGTEEPEPAAGESRGLLARLGGERGQSTAEAMGLLPVLIVFVLGLWQLGLVGYTYVLAGHAAREGARELATDPTNEERDKPFRRVALADLPKAWREGSDIELGRDDVTVSVRLAVPVVLPAVKSPFRIGSEAATPVESQELPPSQALTPTPEPS